MFVKSGIKLAEILPICFFHFSKILFIYEWVCDSVSNSLIQTLDTTCAYNVLTKFFKNQKNVNSYALYFSKIYQKWLDYCHYCLLPQPIILDSLSHMNVTWILKTELSYLTVAILGTEIIIFISVFVLVVLDYQIWRFNYYSNLKFDGIWEYMNSFCEVCIVPKCIAGETWRYQIAYWNYYVFRVSEILEIMGNDPTVGFGIALMGLID